MAILIIWSIVFLILFLEPEEYPEFAPPNNSSFNDVFGLFLNGPGIPGIQNIAKLWNGQLVSINSINPISNTSFYVFNGDGTNSPYNDSLKYIQYDGFTAVLEAKHPIQIAQTYHLTIAISDVGDGIYDSGIFLSSCESCDYNVGIPVNKKVPDFKVYPNPVKGVFVIDDNEKTDLNVYTSHGVLTKIFHLTEGNNQLSISDLSSGSYYFTIVHNDGLWVEKFIISNE